MALKIMILGANGFIGSALTERDPARRATGRSTASTSPTTSSGICRKTDRFHFVEGDITINKEWVEYHVKKCDVVVPLVAIANPAQYVTHPLRVFELDFEANLDDRAPLREVQQAPDLPVDLRDLRHVARRACSMRRRARSSTARSTSSAGSTRPPSSCSIASSTPTACATTSTTRCSGRSTSSARTSTTSRSRRKAARASSRSSSRTCSTSGRSSSSTAASRSAPSPTSTMRSRRC